MRPEATEGGAPDTSLADVSVVESGIDAPDDAAAEGSDADPCDALRAAVVSTLDKAKKCTFGTSGQCSTTVRDECDCDVVVSVAGSTEATAYVQAVADLHAASCPPSPACAASCPVLPSKPSWSCLATSLCFP